MGWFIEQIQLYQRIYIIIFFSFRDGAQAYVFIFPLSNESEKSFISGVTLWGADNGQRQKLKAAACVHVCCYSVPTCSPHVGLVEVQKLVCLLGSFPRYWSLPPMQMLSSEISASAYHHKALKSDEWDRYRIPLACLCHKEPGPRQGTWALIFTRWWSLKRSVARCEILLYLYFYAVFHLLKYAIPIKFIDHEKTALHILSQVPGLTDHSCIDVCFLWPEVTSLLLQFYF